MRRLSSPAAVPVAPRRPGVAAQASSARAEIAVAPNAESIIRTAR
jgi:hypothetical protein